MIWSIPASVHSTAVLLQADSDPNAMDVHRRTPMLLFDSVKILDVLLAKGADVLITDDEGANIMHQVSRDDQAALASTLLRRYGLSLCSANRFGDTPLSLCIQKNSARVMEVMLPLLEDFLESPQSNIFHSRANGHA